MEIKNTETIENRQIEESKPETDFIDISEKKAGELSISLIIPVYNEEKIIERVLKVYDEDLRSKYGIELIVSDGGSEDSTAEIASRYADKMAVHKANRRQNIAEGRNKGAEFADASALVFVNGDTVPENPDAFFSEIHDWISGAGDYADCEALTCKVSIEPSEIKIKDKIFYFIHNRYVQFLNFIGLGMGRGEFQAIKRELFQNLNGYDRFLAAGEDFDLFKRAAKRGKIGFMSDIVVYESPRRFRKYGYLRIILSWISNAISVMLWGKSISDDWEPVR